MQYLLGIDLGTSGTKTVLFDFIGNTICSKTIEYPLYQPANGWAEQDPSDWWNATCNGIKYVLTKGGISASEIAGIGLSGQMHGLVMIDKNGDVLRNSIIWCDQRTTKECEQMNKIVGKKRIIEITANPALTGFTASKIIWVQNNEPEVYEKCAHILLPKDYIRFKLTGEFATEMSDASGMQLMDISKRCWSDEILYKLNIDKSKLGKLYESIDVTGKIHREAAELTGLSMGTIVVGGAADNSAAAIGTGTVREGDAFTTIGTSGVIYAISNDVSIDLKGRVHTFCSAIPNKWTVMSCTLSAGFSLKWLRDTCCYKEIIEAERLGIDPYIIMDRLAEKVKPGAGGLVYLPYLMGERSPHPDPYCRGVFFGLSASHNRANMIRSVMEGVAFSQRECVDIFREMGVSIENMTACGGGGRSPVWRQILSDMYRCPVSTIKTDEGPAFGVAILAGVGAGVYDSVEKACDDLVCQKSIQYPNCSTQKVYDEYYKLYKKVYIDLQESFNNLSKLPK